MRYPLPKDTASALTSQSLQQCRNLGLWLDKLLPINEEKDEKGQDWAHTEDRWRLSDAAKRRQGFNLRLSDPVGKLLRAANERQQSLLANLRSNGATVSEFSAEPDYRLVIGFGAEHVLETNLSLHRIYGFPVIPGSAVKGVARALALWEIAEKLGVPAVSPAETQRRTDAEELSPLQLLDGLLADGDPKKQRDDLAELQGDAACTTVAALRSLDHSGWCGAADEFYQVFGTTARRGQVTFLDAYPKATPKLELDVLNPHFGKYYRRKSAPADYLDPVPTYFLTVAKGSVFQFAVTSKTQILANRASQWLRQALAELGIGGKTSSGYGFMQVKP